MITKTMLYVWLFFANCLFASAQFHSEFHFFDFQIGLHHNIFLPQPVGLAYSTVIAPSGQTQWFYDSGHFDYGSGLQTNLAFRYDTQDNKFGIRTGVGYANIGFGSCLQTSDNKYQIIEKYRVNTLQAFVDFHWGALGDYFELQRYFFVGIGQNFNLNMKIRQTTLWNDDETKRKANKSEFIPCNTFLHAGFNYSVLNFGIEFMPRNFLNKKYNVLNYKPYENQFGNLFFISTSLRYPISKWLIVRDECWRKLKPAIKVIIRLFPFTTEWFGDYAYKKYK